MIHDFNKCFYGSSEIFWVLFLLTLCTISTSFESFKGEWVIRFQRSSVDFEDTERSAGIKLEFGMFSLSVIVIKSSKSLIKLFLWAHIVDCSSRYVIVMALKYRLFFLPFVLVPTDRLLTLIHLRSLPFFLLLASLLFVRYFICLLLLRIRVVWITAWSLALWVLFFIWVLSFALLLWSWAGLRLFVFFYKRFLFLL